MSPPRDALFAGVVGQERALAHLEAALDRPVHAYLFVGPAGSSKESAALGFAAGLVCREGGCGTCESCRRVLRGVHPDVTYVARTGAGLSVDEVRAAVGRALRRPTEAPRQVLILEDVHLATRSTPALLKTLEEPPATTVFVLTAEDVPPDLATVASRCAVVPFSALGQAEVAAWLTSKGVDALLARQVAAGAGGDLSRAELLAGDAGYLERLERWKAVPSRLDGSGATTMAVSDELLASLEEGLEPLRRLHAAQLEQADREAKERGERGATGRRELLERHQRAERRWRTDELRTGLGALQREYRDRLRAALDLHEDEPASAGALEEAKRYADAVARITDASRGLGRNASAPLLLAALLSELGSS